MWLGGQGFAKITDEFILEGYGTGEGFTITGVDLPQLFGRSVSAELRLGTQPFELMIGEEWSKHGVSTDSHLVGVRWNTDELRAQSAGLFLEGVSKFASNDNGGSSLVDGVELRAGVSLALSKSVIVDLLIKYGYFDSSNQEDQPGHVSEGGFVVGLRVGLW